MKYIEKLKHLLELNSYKTLNQYALGYRKSILMLIILNALTSLSGVAIALVTKKIIDYAIARDILNAVQYGILLALIQFAQIGLSSYISFYSVRLSESIKNSIQLKALTSIYGKSWLAINHYRTGDLLTRMNNDIQNIITVLTNVIPTLISLLLQLIVAFGLLYFYDPILATITFLVSPATVLISMLIGTKLKKVQHLIQSVDATQQSLMNESFQNIIIMKAFSYIEKNLELIQQVQAQRFSLIKAKNTISIKSNILLGTGYRLGSFGAIAFGAFRLSTGSISFGTLTAFIQLVGQVQAPIHGMSMSIPQLVSSLSSLDRLMELDQLPEEEINSNTYIALGDPMSCSQLGIINKIPASIVLSNISFGYTSNHTVIKNLNLNIKRGEKIAIIGSSGEGKTTFIHILLALITPDSGKLGIFFKKQDGYESGYEDTFEAITPRTRRYFSYVPQSNSLFSGSIRDNFLLTHEVSEDQIQRALKVSCSYDFIQLLNDGIDSIIGERGIGLSQGQAQRITIARALLHNTPFLIFDEATSALDLKTESEIIQNLITYYPETTLIAVTHRKSIFHICDKVYRLQNGVLQIQA